MNKRLIPILITAISIAIIALISVQIYWINSAVTLKQEEFKRNATEVLSNVVDKLEKDETLSKLRSHEEAQFLFFDEDSLTELSHTLDKLAESIVDYSDDSTYEHIVFKEIHKNDNSLEINITEEEAGKRVTRQITTDAEEKNWTEEEKYLINEHIALKLDVKKNKEKLEVIHEEINIDSLVEMRMEHKTAFVGDIVKRLMEVNLFDDIEGRVDKEGLDSLLAAELSNKGINTIFEFGIYRQNGEVVLESTEDSSCLRETETKMKLFPNDILDSKAFLKLHFPKQNYFLIQQIWWMLCSSIFIVIAIIVVFFYAIRTIISQKEVSEIKNDFINNMTHELKTPISTISLACEALSDSSIAQEPGVSSRYIHMINDENKRLGLLVENVLQSAILDREAFKLKLEVLDIHQLIASAVNKLEMQVNKRGGQISCNLVADKFNLSLDKVHIGNVVSNLIDNAIKYSEDEPKINITTASQANNFKLTVTDNGIGITLENQKKIFDKLYRVPTGNMHNTKGFGLGLSYVKLIVEKHNGTVYVNSSVNKGSTFSIELPINDDRKN
ncbi:HAMP domain-containing histidine kinase [bacterium]|nr:HAMP domain-containing histidine kinase [bacterium]MDC3259964.1 HAMP domain-containing histidine kinase [bacterium]